MPSNEVRAKEKGQPLTAAEYSALVTLAKQSNKIMAAAPLTVAQLPNGQLIQLAQDGLVAIGKAPSTIAALSGATPGSGTVNIWNFTTSNTLAVSDPLVTVTAYNLSSAAVGANKFLQLKRHTSGRWLIDFEAC